MAPPRLAPENTLRSFEAALEHGVDAIEFDVLDAGPGPLVLGHSLAELGPEPATLDDALDFFAGRDVALHVDLKLTTRLDELAAALDRHGVADRAVVSSFHLPSLQAVAAHAPQLPIGFTYPEDRYGVSKRRALKPAIRLGTLALRRAVVTRIPAMIARAGAQALMLQHAVVSPAAVARAHAAGAAVWAWTVDDADRAREARGGGGRCSDHKRSRGSFRAWLHCRREALTLFCPARGLSRRGSALGGLLVGTPSADAQEGTTTGTTTAPPPPPTTTTTTTTTTTPTVPRPTTIAAGVTVGGELLVGGLSPADATSRDQGLLRPPRHAHAREGVAPRDAEAARCVRLRRRRRQARPDRQAGSERAPEGGGAAAADRALRRGAGAPLRPHAGRLGAARSGTASRS